MQLSAAPEICGTGYAQFARWLGIVLLWLCAVAQAAEQGPPVGEVIVLQGIATAQRTGETPRFLERGSALFEGEVINTGSQGYAVIRFLDETKFTLRPNTTFTVERFRQGPKDEAAVFRLLKGGVRALTGLIARRNPANMEVNTVTATIGIRGTAFDARLCENDCADENLRPAPKPGAVPRPELIVARVAIIAGRAQAIGPKGETRALSAGSALFSGDSVRTEKASHVVLAFRDRSKVTVIADSEFKLEDVRFTGPQSDSGNFAVRIVKGGVRAITGLLAKRDPKSVTFRGTTAVIGLRGTGLDAQIAEHCLTDLTCAETFFVSMWEDLSVLFAGGREMLVNTGQTGIYTAIHDALLLLEQTPQFFLTQTAPRPDAVEVNFEELFGALTLDPKFERIRGLTVFVTEGEIILRGPGGFIYLARGESGYLEDGQLVPVRIVPYWEHHLRDLIRRPDEFDPRTGRVMESVSGPGSDLICTIP